VGSRGVLVFGNGSTSNNLIGGTAPGAGNLISGNNIGITLSSSTGTLVQGNLIGTDGLGTTGIGNSRGIDVRSSGNDNTIGGTTAAARNVISGNQDGGIDIQNVATGNVIQGNYIGVGINGTTPIGNGRFGVSVSEGSDNNTIGGTAPGAGNVIANTVDGPGVIVSVDEGNVGVVGVPILSNRIFGNDMGIDLQALGNPGVTPNDVGDADVGPNGLQNFPVITANVASGNATISGTLNSLPGRSYRLEFFANATCDFTGFGQGETPLGATTVTTDGSGNASFGPLVFAVPGGQSIITATATDSAASNTSEFSQCATAGAQATTTALVSSINPSNFGQSVTFTATVTGASPTGTVQFRDGAAVIGTVALAGNAAALVTSSLAPGAHLITAVYSGDVDDATSTSPAVNQIVIAVGEPPGPAEAIPTMSEWMLLVTMALVALAALRRLRRLE